MSTLPYIFGVKEFSHYSYHLSSNHNRHWNSLNKNHKTYENFEKCYKNWLEKDFIFDHNEESSSKEIVSTSNRVGRPSLSYINSSEETRRKKRSAIVSELTLDDCVVALKKKLRLDNNFAGVSVIDMAVDAEYANYIVKNTKKLDSRKLLVEEALALLVDAKLTKVSYNSIRNAALKTNNDIYPPYDEITKAKLDTYPDNIAISESRCEVPLADLLSHTIKRLMKFLNINYPENSNMKLRLTCKLCRKIQILFEKETDDLCLATEKSMEEQLSNFRDVQLAGCSVGVQMMLTMIDGKVCNALNKHKSTQSCFLCGAKPSKLKCILGVTVDKPTPGSGNTNDGNVARKFFELFDKVSTVTGFDKKLLLRFKVILAVISCHKRINVNAFKEYCYTTAEIYIKLYKWYPLPPSIHILLIHGHKIIESLPLPIGILSEEALEANHKNVKRFRDKFTRKDSRIHTNTDLFNRLLMSSDPLVSMCRNTKERKKHDYTQEMRNLILKTDGTETLEYESENDVDESEEES
ncbi:hypothetical protein TKK_0005545 [Trichogramma kaykai]